MIYYLYLCVLFRVLGLCMGLVCLGSILGLRDLQVVTFSLLGGQLYLFVF